MRAVTFVRMLAGRLTPLGCIALASTICHCGSDPPELILAVPGSLALGSEVGVHIASSCRGACDEGQRNTVVESVSVSDTSVIEVRRDSETFQLKTLREGTVSLQVSGRSVDGSSSKDFTELVHVATPDRVTIEPPRECPLPIVVGTGTEFSIRAELFRGADRLWGDPRPFPLSSDVVVWDPNGARFGRLEVTARETGGTGSIRSAVSDEALPIEVADADQVAAIRLEGADGPLTSALSIRRGAVLSFQSTVYVAGRMPCHEVFPRQIAVETPQTCAVTTMIDAGKKFAVEGENVGSCTVVVGVGATVRETIRIEVRQ